MHEDSRTSPPSTSSSTASSLPTLVRALQKRTFSAAAAAAEPTTSADSAALLLSMGTRDTKRPRYATASSSSCTRLLVGDLNPLPSANPPAPARPPSPLVHRPAMVSVECQTDFNLTNSIVVPAVVNTQPPPLRPPKPAAPPQRSLRPAVPPPPVVVRPPPAVTSGSALPVRKVRSSPRLVAQQSSVSVSNVGNVQLPDRKLTSFSSVFRGATIDCAPPKSPQKRERPRLRHTRTSAVDGDEMPPLKRVESSRHLGPFPAFASSSSALPTAAVPEEMDETLRSPKLPKRVGFGGVKVFHFGWALSYDTVPSTGGMPLGMELEHHDVSQFDSPTDYQRERTLERTVSEVAVLDKCSNRKRAKRGLDSTAAMDTTGADPLNTTVAGGAAHNYVARSKNARKQLASSQNIAVDKRVADECMRIIASRQQTAGCSCRNGVCRPNTCTCAQDGIECQVDRLEFPCGCSASGCGNPEGRKEFDAAAVHSHFLETQKRLKAAERDEREMGDLVAEAMGRLRPQLTTPPQSQAAAIKTVPLAVVQPTASASAVEVPVEAPVVATAVEVPKEPLVVPRPPPITPLRHPPLRSSISTQLYTPPLRQCVSVSDILATPANLLNGTPVNVTRRRNFLNRTQMSATTFACTPPKRTPASPVKPKPPTPVRQSPRKRSMDMEVEPTEAEAENSPDLDQTLVAVQLAEVVGKPLEPPAEPTVPFNVFVTSPSAACTSIEVDEPPTVPPAINSTSLLPTSRSISAATTTTEETSRANSTEFQMGE
ncbi:Cysteine/serine-rich nuclear protein 3-like protein [Aphelenchoides fujianensis]|nr:Cysteine/serine-rich nuclear protein 3-like protein [Aphelenchoides fujianensis]